MSKPKKTPPKPFVVLLISSEEAMIGALNRYKELKLDLAARQAINDGKIAALNASFDEEVLPLRGELAGLESGIQLFCENNRKLFTNPKSREYNNATVGFALNPHAVSKRISIDTFEAIAERLEQVEWGEQYLTYKPATMNKEALLKDRAVLSQEQLAEVGIQFTQKEQFFIDLKTTSSEGVSKVTQETVAA